jgi:hypothetical protein
VGVLEFWLCSADAAREMVAQRALARPQNGLPECRLVNANLLCFVEATPHLGIDRIRAHAALRRNGFAIQSCHETKP